MATASCSATLIAFAPSLTANSQTPGASKRCARIPSSSLVPPSLSLLQGSSPRRPFSAQVRKNSFGSPQQQELLVDRRGVSCNVSSTDPLSEGEKVFFDGGVHYGDLVSNLVFGLTLVWLPLTLSAVFRSLFLRYRFTNLRVTIQSGLLGNDRKDFSYEVVKDVKVIPRFIGEWGDMAIELKDGTKVDLRSVPKFREIAKYVQERAGQKTSDSSVLSPTGTTVTTKKGFS